MRKAAIDSKTFLLALLVLGALLTLNSWGYLQGVKNTAISLLSPIQAGLFSSSTSLGEFSRTIGEIGEFKQENERLASENRSLAFELSNLKEVERENSELKAQLRFKDNLCAGSDCVEFHMGHVIARGSDGYGQSITIDLGSENGAKPGRGVTSSGGVMIGKITEVFEDYSKVALIASPESSVNCLAQTTRANGLVKGEYGMGAKLEMIDQSEELMQGDIVITSGLEEGIPKGLLLGKIRSIEASPNMVFKSAELEIFADFGHLEEIFLVEPK